MVHWLNTNDVAVHAGMASQAAGCITGLRLVVSE